MTIKPLSLLLSLSLPLWVALGFHPAWAAANERAELRAALAAKRVGTKAADGGANTNTIATATPATLPGPRQLSPQERSQLREQIRQSRRPSAAGAPAKP